MAHIAPEVFPSKQRSLEERVRDLQLKNTISGRKGNGAAVWVPWILCAMMLFATLSIGWQAFRSPGSFRPAANSGDSNAGGKSQAKTPTPTMPSDSPPETIAPGSVVAESKGYIVPAHQIQVSPIEVAGRIKELFFVEGQWFEKGQVLAKLDDSSFAADLAEANATVSASMAKWQVMKRSWQDEIRQAKEEVEEATRLLEKFKREQVRLKKVLDSGGMISEKEQDEANFNALLQAHRIERLKSVLRIVEGPKEETINAAEAEYNQAKARLDRAQWRFDNCTIKAPVNGNILTKKAEIGNLISPMSFNVSASLCEMADLTRLEVDLEIQEREIAKIDLGQKCKVRCDAYPKRNWDGEVIRIMPVALRAKSAVQVRVRVLNIPKEDAGKYMRPDMGAHVTFFAK
jgi:multidrug resistance efflux pump